MWDISLNPSHLPSSLRLVKRLPAGVGSFSPSGHSQHADALSGVVAVRDCRVPGRRHQRGWAGSSVHNLWNGCYRLHGNFCMTLYNLCLVCFGLMQWYKIMCLCIKLVWIPDWFDGPIFPFILWTTVPDGFLVGCQCSCWKCSWGRKRRASQAIQQGLHHLRMYG